MSLVILFRGGTAPPVAVNGSATGLAGLSATEAGRHDGLGNSTSRLGLAGLETGRHGGLGNGISKFGTTGNVSGLSALTVANLLWPLHRFAARNPLIRR